MADYDDDELFADLYADDAPPPKAAAAQPEAATKPEPEAITAQPPAVEADVKQESYDHQNYQDDGGNGDGYDDDHMKEEYDDGNNGYNNGHENYNDGGGTVGIKEDG